MNDKINGNCPRLRHRLLHMSPLCAGPGNRITRLLLFCVHGNAFIAVGLAVYAFIFPAVLGMRYLHDPALSTPGIPRFVYGWHIKLAKEFEAWARQRVASGRAAEVNPADVCSTEWPVYSAVLYLWATEALQDAWERDPPAAAVMPSVYARGSIEAAAALVSDPNHAAWVRAHWGTGYLERENIFYRMLLISALTTYQRLLRDNKYQALLSRQVESLSSEIDASPYGLLDDYPGECYPVDILPAIAAIRRADDVLGTDHSVFAARAVRAFQGRCLDAKAGLPAYQANSVSGRGIGPARGVGMSFMLIWAPELWTETAREWYAAYEKQFWQQDTILAGFREYSTQTPGLNWLIEVDAGPVIAGYGTTASAFGIGAARANGRFDHALPLTAEAIVAAWPLPDGTLLGPRMLSSISEGPYVGETALLFTLTRRPAAGAAISGGGRIPLVVYLALCLYVFLGLSCIVSAFGSVRRWRKRLPNSHIPAPHWQLGLWAALLVSGIAGALCFNKPIGILIILLAQFLPRLSDKTTGDTQENSGEPQ